MTRYRAWVFGLVALGVVLAGVSAANADYTGHRYLASNGCDLPYWIYVPDDYDSSKAYPLLIYLHGSGNSGTSVDYGGPYAHPNASALRSFASKPESAAFVIVPRTSSSWQAYSAHSVAVFELFEQELTQVQGYNIDLDRVYVTGFSLGGIGAMSWTGTYPEKFAAIGPMAGAVYFGSDSQALAANRAQVATWAFSGANDGTVPADDCRIDLGHQAAEGGDPWHTTYSGAGHNDVWQRVNAEELGLRAWLYGQRSGQPMDSSMLIGWEANTQEVVTLTGAAESVTHPLDFFVGYYGLGDYRITAGAVKTNGTGYITPHPYGRGMATVDGVGSQWINNGDLHVGYAAPGSLHIANGAVVTADEVVVSDMGSLTGNAIINGDLRLEGLFAAGDESITVAPYTVPGTIGGRRPPAISLNMMAEPAPVEVDAEAGAAGSPCGRMMVLGNLLSFGTSTFDIQIGGAAEGEYDGLEVTGSVNITGTLSISLINGFEPANGQRFEIIRGGGSTVTNGFTEVEGAKTPNGYVFSVVHEGGSVFLDVGTGLPGDIDLNGSVSLADFAAFKNSFGMHNASWSDGDFNGDGVVDLEDFVLLKQHFGQSADY